MACVFQAIYAGASPLMELIDEFSSGWAAAWPVLPEGALRSLLVDGRFGRDGVGVSPQIAILFFFIAILKTGLHAPRRHLMDRLLGCGLLASRSSPCCRAVCGPAYGHADHRGLARPYHHHACRPR